MQHDRAHAELARDGAHVLPRCAAEAHQREFARIDAPRDRNLRDRLRHAGVRDLKKARGDFVCAARMARALEFRP